MATFLPSGCITLEEHTTFPGIGDQTDFYNQIWETFPDVRRALLDKEDRRLADMDEGHVSIQVLSHLPGTNKNASNCCKANDEAAEVVAKHPDRYRAFAALPMSEPAAAAMELERAVTQLHLVGAMIDNHLPDMTHYDDSRFWPVFETAEKLDVPIYFHPAPASDSVMCYRFEGNYPQVIAEGLMTGAWGWHENEGLHILKLYAAGLFDRFPSLKIIIGHMGEMIPMMIDRIERLKFFKRGGLGSFKEVWERNIFVTTSGCFSVRTLEMLLKVTPLDHVMYSVDTPFERSETGWRFIEELASKNVLSPEQLEQFVFGNAQKLLKIKVQGD